MKKTIVKNLLILSLAFGALVLIGNNVYGNDTEIKEIDLGEVTITCTQHKGHEARCWRWRVSILDCEWTGNQADMCFIL